MKRRLIAFVCAVICLTVTVASAFATETRASEQISHYSMDVTTSGDTIRVNFSVTSYKLLNKIGCEHITVYEKSGTKWSYVESLFEDDPDMSRSNTFTCTNTIYIDGDADKEYKVIVTIFAEDDNGRDTRTKTFYV